MMMVLAIILVGMLILATAITYIASSSIIHESMAKLNSVTENAAGEVDAWLSAKKDYLRAFAIDLAYLEEITAESILDQDVNHVADNDSFFDIYVGLPNGKAFLSSGFELDYAGGWNATERPWYIGAVADPSVPFVTAPYTDSQSGELCITVSKAIVRDGKIIGVAGVDILITTVNEIVLSTDAGEGSYAFILDKDGNILMHPNEEYGPDEEDVFQMLSEIEDGHYENLWDQVSQDKNNIKFKGSDGKSYFFTYKTINSTGWKYFIALPTNLVYASVWTQIATAAIILAVVMIVAALLVYSRMKKIIVLPVKDMTNAALKLADGDTNINLNKKYFGEIGILANSFNRIADNTKRQAEATREMSTGNLTVPIHIHSDADVMGIALSDMNKKLNSMISEIGEMSSQVTTSSDEVARASQNLADASSAQALKVGEIVNSVRYIQEQNDITGETAQNATEESHLITTTAELGNQKMENLVEAVQSIADASVAVGNVIKVIDDIAFQTNILALNAAVEAARAGAHGRGFAVVADEVSNLASKSTAAAKETSELIDANIKKAELGLSIARETMDALSQIISGIENMAGSMKIMSEQGQTNRAATLQMSQAVETVSNVTHQNSANSEETAAASQEMHQLADSMQKLVEQFRLDKK